MSLPILREKGSKCPHNDKHCYRNYEPQLHGNNQYAPQALSMSTTLHLQTGKEREIAATSWIRSPTKTIPDPDPGICVNPGMRACFGSFPSSSMRLAAIFLLISIVNLHSFHVTHNGMLKRIHSLQMLSVKDSMTELLVPVDQGSRRGRYSSSALSVKKSK